MNISNVDTIENAVNKVKTALNMMPLDGSDYVPSDITSHTLKLLGKDVWGGKLVLQLDWLPLVVKLLPK